jgi:hypothetical protein
MRNIKKNTKGFVRLTAGFKRKNFFTMLEALGSEGELSSRGVS